MKNEKKVEAQIVEDDDNWSVVKKGKVIQGDYEQIKEQNKKLRKENKEKADKDLNNYLAEF